MIISALVLTVFVMAPGCSPSRKFGAGELSRLGRIAVISHGEYRLFYIPSPFAEAKEEEKNLVKELETFLEGFPLAEIMRKKFCMALRARNVPLELVPEASIETIGDTSLPNSLTWAKRNRVDAVIHLESTLEVSHVYRTHDLPLRYYPKIWTEVKIIRLKDNTVLWSKTVWTHAMDGTAKGLKSHSPFDTVFDRDLLEPLIDKKIDFVVKALVKDLI